jgi:hypothetical protein
MITLPAPQNHPVQDFFFRTADRMRVEGCANAIANEGLSLVLYSPHEPLLDHYLSLLLERLRRQTPEPRIEVYFPTNTDSLIARFNDVLAKQSVKEATRQPQENDSAQIWIVHDTQQLPDQEIQLMARLIQNFPGANIRAILLMTGTNPQKASLSALGRKVLRWDIEVPTPEQAQLALEQASHDGQLQAVSQLLRRIGCMPSSTAVPGDEILDLAPGLEASLASRSAAPKAASLWARLRGMPQRVLAEWGQRVPWRNLTLLNAAVKAPPRLAIAAGIALLLSIGLMAWLQPHAFGDAKPSKQPSPVAAAPAAPPGVSSPVAATRTASEPAPEVPDESQRTQAWVRALPPSSFLIQHGSVATYEKALEVKKGVPAQGQAKIVAAFRTGETLAHFVIVSGPFDSLGKAYDSIKRREATRSSWVRATQTLQVQLNGPNQLKENRP